MLKTSISIIMCLFTFTLISGSPEGIFLKASGASFPYPLYKEWIKIYESHSGDKLRYDSIGSGGGIRNFLSRDTDFGGTDAFLSPQEMESALGDVLHIPTCLGAVVIFYNLPGNPQLKLTPELAVDIFLGNILSWSDPRIAKVNPGITLPDKKMTVVHRSDGSGTTFIFTHYLSSVSQEWKKKIGSGKKVKWPLGLGVETNRRIVTFVKKISGSIGYAELTYAFQSKLPVTTLQNSSGHFISPTLTSVSAAAATTLPEDTRTLIVNTDSTNGYPISGFTWFIFYKEQSYNNRTRQQATALARFLWWAIHDGQKYNRKLYYGSLPKEAVKKAEVIIRSMTYQGEPVVDW